MRIKKSEMPLLVLALNTLAVRGERMDAETLNRFNSMARNVNQELGREAVVTMSQTGGK